MNMEVLLEVVGGGGGSQFVLITYNGIYFCAHHLAVLFSHNFQTDIYFKDIDEDGGFVRGCGRMGEAVSQFIITCNGIDFSAQHLAVLFSHNF